MPTISLSELRKSAGSKMAEQDAYFTSKGFIRKGNEYVKDPTYQNSADSVKDQYAIESAPIDLELKKAQLKKAQTEASTAGKTALSADERGVLTFGDVSLDKIGQIEALLGDKKADTGTSTRIRSFLQDRLGITLGQNQQTLGLNTKMSELTAEYGKLISGAAVSDQEFLKRLKPFLPQPSDSKTQIKAKLDNLKLTLKAKQAAVRKQASGSNYSEKDIKDADDFLKGI